MITEDYVSFETAKLLKEKGFEGYSILTIYDENAANAYIKELKEKHLPYCSDDPKLKEFYYTRPTLQMACKWLVREHRLYVNVAPSVEGYYWTEKWHSYVEDLNKRYPSGRFISTLNSPEEACEVAIKYCLENLI